MNPKFSEVLARLEVFKVEVRPPQHGDVVDVAGPAVRLVFLHGRNVRILRPVIGAMLEQGAISNRTCVAVNDFLIEFGRELDRAMQLPDPAERNAAALAVLSRFISTDLRELLDETQRTVKAFAKVEAAMTEEEEIQQAELLERASRPGAARG